jgi:ribonuclease HII
MIAGIDEAGRGPVIGPMVMAIVATDDEDTLRKLGVKDSKLLTHEKRIAIAENLRDLPHEIISLSPSEIDAAVNGENDNLNELEARTTALLIFRLAKKHKISKVILDSPTRTVANYERAVRKSLEKIDKEEITKKIVLVAETKADFNHPVVGAASILAKTTRDTAIAKIAEKHGQIGSGYPADPDTQAFLQKNWKEAHDFFRKSWESYKRLAEGRKQSSLGDFEDTKSKFSDLTKHGFVFVPPTNPYEAVRMKDESVTIISYTTGKLLVQGPPKEKAKTEALLAKLGL